MTVAQLRSVLSVTEPELTQDSSGKFDELSARISGITHNTPPAHGTCVEGKIIMQFFEGFL